MFLDLIDRIKSQSRRQAQPPREVSVVFKTDPQFPRVKQRERVKNPGKSFRAGGSRAATR
jgi:hypothetical protein